ncbi:MAG: ParA family protein [Actinomycetia bacterium]|nr:ParA family protein [Actinomycetes bacterium]
MANKDKKSLTLAVINQKGGVGKSTTSVNLGAALGELGKKTLVIDLDPQGNASSGFGVEKIAGMKSVYDGLVNDTSIQEILQETQCNNVTVVPAAIELAGAEPELANAIAREARLKDLLAPIRDEFDFILIDCPPSLGLLTVNALMAADKLLIPIQSEFYALEGLSKLLDTMKLVKVRLNQSLEIFGVVLTMFDQRTALANQVADEVRRFFGDKLFKTIIPRSVKLAEAPSYGQTILEYAPTSKGAIEYQNLAKEVIKRA